MSDYKEQDAITKSLAEQLVVLGKRLRANSRFPTKEDNNLALSMFEKAGDLGSAAGMAAAGAMYNEPVYGVEQDRIKAESFYAKAVEMSSGAAAGSVSSYLAASWAYEHACLHSYNSDNNAENNTQKTSVDAFLGSRGYAQLNDGSPTAVEVSAPKTKGPSQ